LDRLRQTDCAPEGKRPHILLIHHESMTPPAAFKGLQYDHDLDSFFTEPDGKLNRLRVETYGGGSWISEFSLLSGLSSLSFGNMRAFLQVFLAGRLAETLPQYLARCGYRTVLFFPADRNFVSNAKFYEGMGLTVFDRRDQGAASFKERDRFYYENVLAELRRHLSAEGPPIFIYIQTNASHAPYTSTFAPEFTVGAGEPGTPPQINEWLRRVAIAKSDYAFFRNELAHQMPNEQFLFVRYGDLHPLITRPLLGLPSGPNTRNYEVRPEETPDAFLTYYVIEGLNYTVPALPHYDAVDVAYLSTLLLIGARLPLSDSHSERYRLMSICNGRYFGCPQEGAIEDFHRRLIDAGLIETRRE
jgi:hypothetical protein